MNVNCYYFYIVSTEKNFPKYYVMKLKFASKHKSIILHAYTCHYQYNALHSALIGSELFCWWVNFHAPLAQAVWFEEHKLVSPVHKNKFIPKSLQNLLYFKHFLDRSVQGRKVQTGYTALIEAPTHEILNTEPGPDHSTGNSMPYSFR